MKDERKLQADGKTPHMEKQVMPEPMEEFVDDQSIPSKSMQSGSSEHTSPDRAFDVKPAGHQNPRDEVFEPGVEG